MRIVLCSSPSSWYGLSFYESEPAPGDMVVTTVDYRTRKSHYPIGTVGMVRQVSGRPGSSTLLIQVGNRRISILEKDAVFLGCMWHDPDFYPGKQAKITPKGRESFLATIVVSSASHFVWVHPRTGKIYEQELPKPEYANPVEKANPAETKERGNVRDSVGSTRVVSARLRKIFELEE